MSSREKRKQLTESMEMYLKTIMLLERRRKVARVRDIAESMDVSMSSVTSAMKGLKRRSLIKQDKYDYIRAKID